MKLKGLARDTVGVGSLPIYIIFFVASTFFDLTITLFLFLGLLLQGFMSIFVGFNKYIARFTLLLTASALFFSFELFIFMTIILILVLISFYYLKEKKISLIKSAIISALISVVSYFFHDFLMKIIGG
ncbi:MAG: hypothetical protein ACMXX6_01555 [Candidatus Woesearchaeota archaeon]